MEKEEVEKEVEERSLRILNILSTYPLLLFMHEYKSQSCAIVSLSERSKLEPL